MREWHIRAAKFFDLVQPIGVMNLETSTITGVNNTDSSCLSS